MGLAFFAGYVVQWVGVVRAPAWGRWYARSPQVSAGDSNLLTSLTERLKHVEELTSNNAMLNRQNAELRDGKEALEKELRDLREAAASSPPGPKRARHSILARRLWRRRSPWEQLGLEPLLVAGIPRRQRHRPLARPAPINTATCLFTTGSRLACRSHLAVGVMTGVGRYLQRFELLLDRSQNRSLGILTGQLTSSRTSRSISSPSSSMSDMRFELQ